MTAFAELGIVPELITSIEEMGWMLPTDIQQEGIPAILGGADVGMAAPTGSGKTGAFCLPVIQVIWETLRNIKKTKEKIINSEEDGWNVNVFDCSYGVHVDLASFTVKCLHPKFWKGGRANKGILNRGKYYYEVTVIESGLCRVGWSTKRAKLDLGTCCNGYGYGGTGLKSFSDNFEPYGESFTKNDVIGCYLDLDSRNIHFSKNGHEFEVAFEISQSLASSSFYPAFCLKNNCVKLNFGHTAFNFPPKKGYVGLTLASSDCVELSIKNIANVKAKRPNSAPLCIILEPTKELAQQTHEQIKLFSKRLVSPTLRPILCSGDVLIGNQTKDFEERVDVITCTPGRCSELIRLELIELSHVRFFVLDEADILLADFNYLKTIYSIYNTIPCIPFDDSMLQTIVCSATFHNFVVRKRADTIMHFPQWIDLKGQDIVPDTVHQVVCVVDPIADRSWIRLRSKSGNGITTDGIHEFDELRPNTHEPKTLSEGVKILKGEYVIKAIRHFKMDRCIIFCRTKVDCDNMEKHIASKDPEWTCACFHGNLKSRLENLQKFKNGEVKFLICTDLAARGIDVYEVPFVINVTLPLITEVTNYVHRVGRVGRTDRMGLAISLVAKVPEQVWFHKNCQKKCKNTKSEKNCGCTIWFSERQSLAEIEKYLGFTIARVSTDFDVPIDDYDGKVVYGRRVADETAMEVSLTQTAVELTGIVRELSTLERQSQLSYWKLQMNCNF